jgi:hypothetical protein
MNVVPPLGNFYLIEIIMSGKVYYIKAQNGDAASAIKEALLHTLGILSSENFSNIKLVLSHSDMIKDPPNFFSEAWDKILPGKGVAITKALNKQKGFSMPGVPKEGVTTGINVLLINNKPSFPVTQGKTIVILYNTSYDSLKEIKTLLFGIDVDVVGIVQYDTDDLNELLSSLQATNISSTADPNVVPYSNTFSADENEIMKSLKTINISDAPSHVPTLETMKRVIDNLKASNFQVSYGSFLGYLLNDVKYSANDSIELMKRQNKFFNR